MGFLNVVFPFNNVVPVGKHVFVWFNNVVPGNNNVVFRFYNVVPARNNVVLSFYNVVPAKNNVLPDVSNVVPPGNRKTIQLVPRYRGLFMESVRGWHRNTATMNYDSSPPVYYDSPLARYDDFTTPSLQPRRVMDYVALKLNEKTLDEKLTLTTNLAAALTTNVADYADPDPTPVEMTGKVTAINLKKTAISAAQAVVDGLKGELADMEAELDATLTKSGAYIQEASGGVAAKIALLNLETKSRMTTPSSPGQVQGFKLLPGLNAGEIKSVCKPEPNSMSYEYQMTLDPTKESSWALFNTSSGCRATHTGLTSGTKVWLRARGVGGKKTGKGPWSDPACITVP